MTLCRKALHPAVERILAGILFMTLLLIMPHEGIAASPSALKHEKNINPDNATDKQARTWQDEGIDFDKIKERFMLFGNLTTLFSYSRLLGDSGLWGGNVSGYIAPAYKINDKTFFLLLINGNYSKTKTVYQEDKGSRVSTESITYTFTPTLKYDISKTLSISPSLLYSTFLSRTNGSTPWRTDLYDYVDRGFGLSANWVVEETKTSKKDWNFVAQYYSRNYPNYSSLYSMAGLGSFEEKEKDSNSYLLSAEYNSKNAEKFSYRFFASALLKRMTEKLVENSSGERDPKKQKDNLYTVENNFKYKSNETYTFLLNTSFGFNYSNQNLASGTFPSIEFSENYHGYYSVNIKPGIEYTTTLSGKELILKGSYGFTIKKYDERRAKDANSTTLQAREQDLTHSYTLDATYHFNKHWDLLATSSLDVYRSNYRDESTYRYNYEVFKAQVGFSYNF